MPPVQPPLLPLGLTSPWCGKPCLTRSLFLLLRGEFNTNEGIFVMECIFCVFTDNEGNIRLVMYVNLMGDVAGEAARGKNVFLTGVYTKHEYLQGMVVECYVALLVLFVTSLDVACVGDFAWPCPSRCKYAHSTVMWHAPCFQVLVLWDAAMLAARKISAYQLLKKNFDVCALVVSKDDDDVMMICSDGYLVFLKVDVDKLVMCRDGNFFGLKVNDDWMVLCNDGISVFPVPMDLNQWLIGCIFLVLVGFPGSVISCFSVVFPMTQ